MTQFRSPPFLASAFAAALFAVLPLAAHSQTAPPTASQSLIPDSGRINRGDDRKLRSSSAERKLPSPAESRAALMMPDPGTISPGKDASTTGAASTDAGPGPIGSTMQTMPAKFSNRNDVLDRTPVMVWPLLLSDEQRRLIYQAVMADKTPAAGGIDALKPAQAVPFDQQDDMRPLPATLREIPGIEKLKYVKTKDKVLLVQPDTAIVVDEITAS